MIKYYAVPISTKYWKPNTDYIEEILKGIEKIICNNDCLVISEKAISIASNQIIDELKIRPTLSAKIISKIWMRQLWGYPLGILCGFGQNLLHRIRSYPIGPGSQHKQVALQYAGFLQSLMFGSEGGIDGSNLPYSFVSLPLKNPEKIAKKIKQEIRKKLQKKITVIITDSDKTYIFRNIYFTPRPGPIEGIKGNGGIAVYLLARILKLKKRSTPTAVTGNRLQISEVLKIANIADKVRGPGAGATVWDMAARFKVKITEVNWNMLSNIEHKPIVIVRGVKTTK